MTDKLRAAAEMALEALQEYTDVVATAHDADNWHQVIDGGKPAREAIQALRQALAEPDTGVDRGAWSDVPDATKWVDELRGDDDLELAPPGNYVANPEPPNSTTDVVEPVAWFTEDYETDKSATTYNAETARRWLEKGWPVTPLYTAPPKREWQGLTDEEIEEGYELCWVQSKQAWESAVWWAEAKIKEKNT